MMDLKAYNDDFTRYDCVQVEIEDDIENRAGEPIMDDSEHYDVVVPQYLRQISESLAVIADYLRELNTVQDRSRGHLQDIFRNLP